MSLERPNPFLGPRSFRTGEAIYGRDREARDLLSLLIAERIVLLHSPSGAGKTSLLQAAIFPMLESRDFLVLPVIRVNAAPPALADAPAPNRYLLSTMLALEEGLPAEEQIPLAELARLSLAEYLAKRILPDTDAVLLFDQFEELLTADVTDIAAKQEFCAQLGVALRDRRYWALFSMRDDYVAAMEPYAGALPTRLAHHFRLELLGVDGARQALAEPARKAGVPFSDEAVTQLADDLRRVNVQQADGSIQEQLGPSVEPVQLQVVGLRIWAGLPPAATAISAANVAAVGDVNQALAGYYDERLAAVAVAGGHDERAMRRWFEQELITPQGVRGQVLQDQAQSAGLPNEAIRALVETYLVRAEQRRGATWFELSHDRLIAPVRASNAAWFAAKLSIFQRQADLWAGQGRPEGLLLRGAALAEAEGWAAANAAGLTPTERDFLALCRAARRRAALLRSLSVGVAVAAVVALALAFVANSFRVQSDANAREADQQRGTAVSNGQIAEANARTAEANRQLADQQRAVAEQNARLSRARELAAAADVSLSNDPQRSLLLGLAAVDTTRAAGEPVTAQAVESLQRAAQAARVEHILRGHTGAVRKVAYSPDGSSLASAGVDGLVILWDRASGSERAQLTGHTDEIYALAYSPDGASLASAGADGAVIIWDVAGGAERRRLEGEPDVVFTALAYSPDGATLASAGDDGTATLWDVASGAQRASLTVDPDYSLDAVAFSPDGAQLALGGGDGVVRVWEVATLATADPASPLLALRGHSGSLTGLAYSPDGVYVIGVGLDLQPLVWVAATGQFWGALSGHTSSTYDVAVSPASDLIATASADGTARVWRVSDKQTMLTLAGHADLVHGVAFSPDGQQVATASADGTLRLWSLALAAPDSAVVFAASPDGGLFATVGASGVRLWDAASGATRALLPNAGRSASGVAFSPDGATLAVGYDDGLVRLWDVPGLRGGSPDAPRLELSGHSEPIGRLAFSPDGRRLASASDDATVRVWDVASGEQQLLLEAFGNFVYAVAFSPDGARLAAADQDGLLLIVDAASGAEQARVKADSALNSLAFSPDGSRLAAGADDGKVYFYGSGGAAQGDLTHGAQVSFVAYGPDGTLASAAYDGAVRLWAEDGTPRAVLTLPGSVYALAFMPQSRLAAVSADGAVHVFPLELDALTAAAKGRLVRGPSAEECKDYRLTDGCP